MTRDRVRQGALPRTETPIPGLVVFDLPVHGDSRGWFKENWQREKMTALGPARLRAGAEQHLVQRRRRHHPRHPRRAVGQVGLGRDRADLRRLGRPARRAHLRRRRSPPSSTRPGRSSCRAASATPTRPSNRTPPTPTSSTTTGRPTRRTRSSTSPTRPPPSPGRSRSPTSRSPPKDLAHPRLADVTPIAAAQDPRPRRRRPARPRPARRVRRRARTSSTRPAPTSTSPRPTSRPRAAGATTTPSSTPPPTPPSTLAETPDGRDATRGRRTSPAVAALAAVAAANGITLVHVSSDYVFDGTADRPYTRGRPGLPARRLRADQGRRRRRRRHRAPPLHRPHVLGDRRRQELRPHHGLARRTRHRPESRRRPDRAPHLHRRHRRAASATCSTPGPPYGIYNLTGAGEPVSWADIARAVFALTGHDPARVTGVTTDEYFASAQGPVAPRPRNSVLDLAKLEATGFAPADQRSALAAYLAG